MAAAPRPHSVRGSDCVRAGPGASNGPISAVMTGVAGEVNHQSYRPNCVLQMDCLKGANLGALTLIASPHNKHSIKGGTELLIDYGSYDLSLKVLAGDEDEPAGKQRRMEDFFHSAPTDDPTPPANETIAEADTFRLIKSADDDGKVCVCVCAVSLFKKGEIIIR